jgi:hypothetical protein
MAVDPQEAKDGGVLRDRYGRRQMVAVDKHATPAGTDIPAPDGMQDADGRDQVVLLSPDGTDLGEALQSATVFSEQLPNVEQGEYEELRTGDDWSASFAAIRDYVGAGGAFGTGRRTYEVDAFAPLDKQHIRGAGPDATTLKAKAGAARAVAFDGRWFGKLSDLTVDGRSKASDGIRIRGMNTGGGGQSSQRHMLDHVRVTQAATGVRVDGADASSQVDKNLYVDLWVDNCTVGFESVTSNSQNQCFIGGSIDDCVTHAIKTNGTMVFIGWQAQQTLGGAGVTMMEFTGPLVQSIVMIDCITETHDVTFEPGASDYWPVGGVQVYSSVLQANTHIAKVDRGGQYVALIVRGSRLNGGTIDLRDGGVFVDEWNDPLSTTTVTRSGAGTRWHRNVLSGAEGAAVASASTVTIPAGATKAIQSIAPATAHHGQEVEFILTTAITFQTGGNLKLAGGVNFVGTADDAIRFVYSGIDGWWRESGRSVNA